MSTLLRCKTPRIIILLLFCLSTTACIGTVVGAVVDTTIEVVKIPFKVGAAVVDVVTDDDSNDFTESANKSNKGLANDAAAVEMENAEFE